MHSKVTLVEILSQPEVWQQTILAFNQQKGDLLKFWKEGNFTQVIFIGCGSTHYLAKTGAALFQSLNGITAIATASSEMLFFPQMIYPKIGKILLVAISRSGESTETVEVVRDFKHRDIGNVLVVTTEIGSKLAKEGDYILCATQAVEKSVAQTRSFSSMLIFIQSFCALVAGADPAENNSLPEIASQLIEKYQSLIRTLAENDNLERFYFLGEGPLYGIALEANLKMKEMSLSYSEGYQTLEFRHGPKSMVNQRTLVVGLISSQNAGEEIKVLKEMQGLGARILMLTPDVVQLEGAEIIKFGNDIADFCRPATFLPLLQLMACYRAIWKGLDPDNPKNLTQVVYLDLNKVQPS